MTTAPTSRASVSNLVMTWDPPEADMAERAVELIDVEAAHAVLRPRYELLAEETSTTITWEQDANGLGHAVGHAVVGANDVEPRERRSAFEVAFLMLAAALAILVATPPLVQLFLAMRGIQA